MMTPNTPLIDPDSRPERTHVRLGFVALSDAAPLAAARMLELGKRHGLTLELCRQPSWSAVRDKLLSGEIDAAHALYGLVYGAHVGIGGPQADMAVLMVLNRNGQAITLSNTLADALRETGHLKTALATLGRKPVFAQTFPTGTHAMWLYHWLAAQGVDPLRDIDNVVIPPPQMAQTLAAGHLDGFCVGEPWNALAEAQQAGRTVALSSEVWPNHPEKVLASRRDFVSLYPNTSRALIQTLLEACQWLDDLSHRAEIATRLAQSDLLNVDRDVIAPRLMGDFEPGRFTLPTLAVNFCDNGNVNYPRMSDGLWFLTQFRRWGMMEGRRDDVETARTINQTSLYREAATRLGLHVPDEIQSDVLCDGIAWDGRDPAGYLDALTIRA
jgi:nitrate/nitrite transport system substrate-binding protein